MDYEFDEAAELRLQNFIGGIGAILGNDSRRASFGLYAVGLLGEGERKSCEPIAARACPDPDRVGAVHQRVQHFITDSRWSDRDIRRYSARHALSAMTEREQVSAWIIDDTGWLKQGTHSVGVQRQYTGSAGKVANCQLGTSLVVATQTMHVAIDFELYLPQSWTEDVERRREARIPEHVEFKTKPQQALEMIRRAVRDDVPRGVVLADCAFGDSHEFRTGVRELGLHYAVGVEAPTKVVRIDGAGRKQGYRGSVESIARRLRASGRRAFRRVTWREGTNRSLCSRFAVQRVVPARSKGRRSDKPEHVWLLIEWPDGEPGPTHYYFISIPKLTRKKMVRLVKERYRTEVAYQELKGELGLDHFEGRRYTGWHHHVSLVLSCHAFLVAERARRFSPSARGTTPANSVAIAA
jgi:SRSO17 transposase